MEPRLLRHGNPVFTDHGERSATGFNGATSSQTWKSGFIWYRRGISVIRASMEPRLLRHGNCNESHVRRSIRSRRASMEPRLLRHGNFKSVLAILNSFLHRASMEPRLLRHGNVNDYIRACMERMKLQWSHVFSDMEIPTIVCRNIFGDDGFNGATSSQTWKSHD